LTHILVFKEIVANLTSMEVKFEDGDLALLLLCSLPALFNNFQNTILYSHDTLPVAEIYEALITVTSPPFTNTVSRNQDHYGASLQKLL
jgi:hypothetical protein